MSGKIRIKKINNEVVKPIKVPVVDPDKVGGFSLFENLYANIFLCAKKNSGKTNAIFKILQKCAGKNTDIYIFCSTAKKDATWLAIRKYFKKKKNNVYVHLSTREEKDDILKDIMDFLKNPDSDNDSGSDDSDGGGEFYKRPLIIVDEDEEDNDNDKTGKSGKVYPEAIFIFDDIGNELISKTITQFLKTNRHYHPKIIISSQNVNDIHPSARNQIDYWLLFGGHSKAKIEEIHKNASLSIEPEDLLNIYNFATKEKYSFLYIDARKNKYRKNFDTSIMLE